MAAPDQASLPPFFTLTKGQTVRFTALDPTDGSVVSGVTISGMRLSVDSTDALPPAAAVAVQPVYFMPGSA